MIHLNPFWHGVENFLLRLLLKSEVFPSLTLSTEVLYTSLCLFLLFLYSPLKMKGKVSSEYETANYLFSFGIIHFVVNIFFSTYLKILLRCVWYWNLGKFFIFTFFTLPWYFKIRLWVILQLYDQQNALQRFNLN